MNESFVIGFAPAESHLIHHGVCSNCRRVYQATLDQWKYMGTDSNDGSKLHVTDCKCGSTVIARRGELPKFEREQLVDADGKKITPPDQKKGKGKKTTETPTEV